MFQSIGFFIFKLEPSPQSLPTRDFCSTHAWLHVGPGLGILPSSWEKGILMASLGLCVFPSQNDKSSTPGLKSNTPTPRNDAPTPGTSTTPGLRSMPGKPPGMDPIGIMGRHHRARVNLMGEGRMVPCQVEPNRWRATWCVQAGASGVCLVVLSFFDIGISESLRPLLGQVWGRSI